MLPRLPFHTLAAQRENRGNGLRPELLALLERGPRGKQASARASSRTKPDFRANVRTRPRITRTRRRSDAARAPRGHQLDATLSSTKSLISRRASSDT